MVVKIDIFSGINILVVLSSLRGGIGTDVGRYLVKKSVAK